MYFSLQCHPTQQQSKGLSAFLKRVKTYLLSTMRQERLSALALLLTYTQTHSASIECSGRQV